MSQEAAREFLENADEALMALSFPEPETWE